MQIITKEFECFWGAGYHDADNKSKLAYHPTSFFNAENGYEEDDIKHIRNLSVGEDYVFDRIFGEHWVRRIK